MLAQVIDRIGSCYDTSNASGTIDTTAMHFYRTRLLFALTLLALTLDGASAECTYSKYEKFMDEAKLSSFQDPDWLSRSTVGWKVSFECVKLHHTLIYMYNKKDDAYCGSRVGDLLTTVEPIAKELNSRYYYGHLHRNLEKAISNYLESCKEHDKGELDAILSELHAEDPDITKKVDDLHQAYVAEYDSEDTTQALLWYPDSTMIGHAVNNVLEKHLEDPSLRIILDTTGPQTVSKSKALDIFDRYAYKPCVKFNASLELVTRTLKIGRTKVAITLHPTVELALKKFQICEKILSRPKYVFEGFEESIRDRTDKVLKDGNSLKFGKSVPAWYSGAKTDLRVD